MEQIRFVLERFYNGWKINSFVFDKDNCLLEYCIEGLQLSKDESLHLKNEAVEENFKMFFPKLKEKDKQIDAPMIHMEQDGIYYVSFWDSEEHFFLFGPASVDNLSFVQQMSYRKRHHVPNQKYQVPKVSFAKVLNGVALVYYVLTGKQFTEQAIMENSEISSELKINLEDIMSYEIQNTTEEKQHLAYQDEMHWIASIENGTLEPKAERLTPENMKKMEQIGTLAKSNSLKQFEYMAVTSCCLASRAAIRGGVNAYEAYRTSEMFLQKISVCTNVMEILQIHMEISNTFSQMVRNVKESAGLDCIEQCKDYIARHRTQKFSLNDVAKAVGKNPSYLSRVFSEQTGMTMQEYALNVRLEAAANILQYSTESIGNIAEYLNFPSQSYFGERFKKKYRATPAEYRRKHKIRDFKEK